MLSQLTFSTTFERAGLSEVFLRTQEGLALNESVFLVESRYKNRTQIQKPANLAVEI